MDVHWAGLVIVIVWFQVAGKLGWVGALAPSPKLAWIVAWQLELSLGLCLGLAHGPAYGLRSFVMCWLLTEDNVPEDICPLRFCPDVQI